MAQYDIDLRDYWRVVKKRKPIIIFSMVTMFIFSFIFANFKKNQITFIYSSSAAVKIEKQVSASDFGMSSYAASDDIETEVSTITSFPVLAEVAYRVGYLDDHADTLATMTIEERRLYIQSDPDLLSAANSLTGSINPQRRGYGTVIDIQTQDYLPESARDLAQHTVEAYKDIRRRDMNKSKLNRIDFVREQIILMESSIDSLQMEIQSQSQKEGNLNYLTSINVQVEINNVNRERNIVVSKRLATESMITELEKEGTIDDSKFSNTFVEGEGGIFRQSYTELLRFYEIRDERMLYYTAEHPQMKSLSTQIENQKQSLLNQLKSNLATRDIQLANHDATIKELRTQFDTIIESDASVKRLKERYALLDFKFQNLQSTLQDLEIEGSENVDEVMIMKPAVYNPNPTNSAASVSTISFIGLFLGTIIGMTAAFIFEALDTSIGTIEDVESYLGVPVIGLIPQMGPEMLKKEQYAIGGKKQDEEASDDLAMLVIHFAPKSVLAESYRSMRTNIQFISYEQAAKVLLFTSTSPSEGKTTSIVNLALTMAQSGNHVLLIDADLRRPSIDGLFGLERENGLSEILLGKRYWKECIKTVADIITGKLGMSDIILEPGIDNLHIITSGSIPPNPSELLSSDSVDEFVSNVREEYDIVLFDCAPTLPATDSAVLGRKIDGIVFVYAVGKVSRGSLKRATSQIASVKANVIGVVLNGIRAETSADFQDYKYKEYYYAYSEDEGEESSTKVNKIKRFVTDIMDRFS